MSTFLNEFALIIDEGKKFISWMNFMCLDEAWMQR